MGVFKNGRFWAPFIEIGCHSPLVDYWTFTPNGELQPATY